MNKQDKATVARYKKLGIEAAAVNKLIRGGRGFFMAHPDANIGAYNSAAWRVKQVLIVCDPEFGGVHVDLEPPDHPDFAGMGVTCRFISDEVWAELRKLAGVAAYEPPVRGQKRLEAARW